MTELLPRWCYGDVVSSGTAALLQAQQCQDNDGSRGSRNIMPSHAAPPIGTFVSTGISLKIPARKFRPHK
jgi:hypothetical protein